MEKDFDKQIKRIGDPFLVLNISKDSNKNQVKLAYKKLVKIFHPDKVTGN